MQISAVDYHTGGEPFRIVTDAPVRFPGDTVAERRATAAQDAEVRYVRELLCFEPRGHADMYGGFITPPDDDGAHFGVLFWHKDGFSTACGHGTIALGAWAVATGRVPAAADGPTDVVIDVPSGRVTARVHRIGGTVSHVDFVSVPSHAIATGVEVVTGAGPVTVDIGYGGAIYAHLDVRTVGLSLDPARLPRLIELGREVKWLLNDSAFAQHTDSRLSGVYGTILYEDDGVDDDGALRQKNMTVFADGEVDRSPCGSGTASRVAVLAAQGRMRPGQLLRHTSVVGSEFLARFTPGAPVDGVPTVVPVVTGTAYRTGAHEFTVDPADTLVPGFVLR